VDLGNTLRKIRAQIKFGRVPGVRNSLVSLLDQYTDSEHEVEILEVFFFSLFKIHQRLQKCHPATKSTSFTEHSRESSKAIR
jgi:hypothetical protein